MFEKNALHVRLKKASAELVLSWLDKWNDDEKYNLDEEDEKIILDREEPLLDAALAEYSSEAESLARIFARGDISLKKACLRNNRRGHWGLNEWPYEGTSYSLFNEASIENGLLECLVTNPQFELNYALDVIEKNNEFREIDDKIWLRFVSLICSNPLMQKRDDFGEAYYIRTHIWRLSQNLVVNQENADFLYNLYSSIAPIDSDDPKQMRTDMYESEKGTERDFVVEKAIKRWASFVPREEDKVRQGFFLIKGRSGADICLELLRNLQSDTAYFTKLENHESASYREYFYEKVEFYYYHEDSIEILNTWFEKDGDMFLESICKNHSIAFDYDRRKWIKSKIEEVDDRDLREILEYRLSDLIGLETKLPDHLKHSFEISTIKALDAKRVDRLGLQIDLLFKNLLGVRDINDDHTYIEKESTLSILGENLSAIKYLNGHLLKKISVINTLVIFSLILTILLLFVSMS